MTPSHFPGKKPGLLLFLVFVWLCGTPAWAEKPAPSVASAIDLVEWMFQRPLTCVEIQSLGEQKGWESWAERSQSLDHPSPDVRASWLRQFQSDSQPFATLACKMDKVARKEIAPGLQFQCSEAFAEWLLFGMAVIDGEETQVLPGPHFRGAVQATLVGLWPKLPVHTKEFLTGFPAYWAKMRKAWPTMEFAAKNRVVVAWQNNLANTLQSNDRIRLAAACLEDLQETMRQDPTPQALDIACNRLEFSARRLRRPDTKATALADELTQFATQTRKQQSNQAQAAALLKKMDLPEWRPVIWAEPQMFPGYYGGWGWGNGYPYRW